MHSIYLHSITQKDQQSAIYTLLLYPGQSHLFRLEYLKSSLSQNAYHNYLQLQHQFDIFQILVIGVYICYFPHHIHVH